MATKMIKIVTGTTIATINASWDIYDFIVRYLPFLLQLLVWASQNSEQKKGAERKRAKGIAWPTSKLRGQWGEKIKAICDAPYHPLSRPVETFTLKLHLSERLGRMESWHSYQHQAGADRLRCKRCGVGVFFPGMVDASALQIVTSPMLGCSGA